jgi:hypothetical protein
MGDLMEPALNGGDFQPVRGRGPESPLVTVVRNASEQKVYDSVMHAAEEMLKLRVLHRHGEVFYGIRLPADATFKKCADLEGFLVVLKPFLPRGVKIVEYSDRHLILRGFPAPSDDWLTFYLRTVA